MSPMQASRITPPLRGSRREQSAARRRAGGGQSRRPVSDDQRLGKRRVGGGSIPRQSQGADPAPDGPDAASAASRS